MSGCQNFQKLIKIFRPRQVCVYCNGNFRQHMWSILISQAENGRKFVNRVTYKCWYCERYRHTYHE